MAVMLSSLAFKNSVSYSNEKKGKDIHVLNITKLKVLLQKSKFQQSLTQNIPKKRKESSTPGS